MFTVVLLSEEAHQSLARWRELFTPYEEEGRLQFCRWHHTQSSETLSQAVPDLTGAIKGKQEWRALVVGTGTMGRDPDRGWECENPFDLAAVYADMAEEHLAPQRDAIFDHSRFDLVRLTHMLLGFPELGPREFVPDPSFLDKDTERRRYMSEFIADAENAHQLKEQEDLFQAEQMVGHDPQIHYRVINASVEERERHAELTRFYEVRQVRPTEVVLVAARSPLDERPEDYLRASWNSHEVHSPSRFVERNNYPPSCRFALFDIKSREHASFDLEEMRFWLSILTLAINDLPASGLQAERAYRLDVSIRENVLADVVNAHLMDLVAARDYIDAKLQSTRVSSRPADSSILVDIPLNVDFSRLKGEVLRVDPTGYSLATDVPTNEADRWRAEHAVLSSTASQFLREPARALRQAVHETHAAVQTTAQDSSPLGEIDILELEEELAKRTGGLVRRASGDIADTVGLSRIIQEHNRTISLAIGERMRKQTILTAVAVVFGAWLAALLPYLIGAYFNGAVNLLESLLVTLIALGIIAGVALITLEVMRRRLISLINGFNRDLRAFVADVIRGAQQYSEFLTDLVTYAGGRKRLIQERRRVEAMRAQRLRLRHFQRRINDKIELEKSLVRSLDRPLHIGQGGHVVSDLEKFGLSHIDNVLLWQTGRTQCEFNWSGDDIDAPYPFVKRFVLQDLNLREELPNSQSSGYQQHNTEEV